MKKSAFTLAEVTIAKRARGELSLLNISRVSELKAPSLKAQKRGAFTLAEVTIAKREREKMSLLNLFLTRELKAPSSKLLKRCAFTLAEVLITLGIIGVVAAMTIPTLVANYQKSQYVTQLKENYSLLSQALQQLKADEGVDKISDSNMLTCSDSEYTDCVQRNGVFLKKYFKVIKDCGAATDQDCFASDYYSIDKAVMVQ